MTMVCVLIRRKPQEVDDNTAITIRDAFQRAVIKVFKVKAEDVDVLVRDIGPLDICWSNLYVEIDAGPGAKGLRLEQCRQILTDIDLEVVPHVPQELQRKGKSNQWVRLFAAGASMPIGCPEHMH